MTLHSTDSVGVRELHDRLSAYLERVERGDDVIITRGGKAIARLSSLGLDDDLEDLVRRGLVTAPERGRRSAKPTVKARGPGSIADLVAEQRR